MKMNSFQLKCLALLLMVIDHIGVILYPQQLIFRYIGRLAFPIFCFLLVEGFYHTRNIWNYLARMGTFALLSEIPHDLAFHQTLIEFTKQNVFFTLTLGLGLLYVIKITNSWWEKGLFILIAMWAAEWFAFDYSFRGILLILIFYFFHKDHKITALGVVLGVCWNFIRPRFWKIQGYGAFALIPILLYNGERGRKMKYMFYIFYPVHLLVLYAISLFR